MLLTLLVVYLIALFTYSLGNLANDYHFIYGAPLKSFWMLALKGTSLLVLTCSLLMVFKSFKLVGVQSDYFLDITMYLLVVVVLIPIPIYLIYLYVMYHMSRVR